MDLLYSAVSEESESQLETKKMAFNKLATAKLALFQNLLSLNVLVLVNKTWEN